MKILLISAFIAYKYLSCNCFKLQFHRNTHVEASAGEIIWHGKLVAADVGYPVVGVDVADAKEVERVAAQP